MSTLSPDVDYAPQARPIISERKKKGPLSLSRKVDLIRAVEEGQKTRTVLASEFGLSKSSVSDIVKQKDKLLEAYTSGEYAPHRKRMRKSMYSDVEDALLIWLRQSLHFNVPVSGPIIQKKAKEFADILGHPQFTCSSGWLARFKARHMITFRNNTCEIGTTSGELINNKWVAAQLPSSLCEFPLDSIYVAYVCGLLWKCLPSEASSHREEKCLCGDRAEDRLTALVCTNMTGSDKLPLLVVGNSHKPKCFGNYNPNLVYYESNPLSWMTCDAVASWLKEVDRRFAKEQQKVALIVDHSIIDSITKFNLEAVRLVYLPPSSVLHSAATCVVRGLKTHYRRYLMVDILAAIDADREHSLQLLDALFLLASAWGRVSSSTITHAFKLCGFAQSDSSDAASHSQEEESAALAEGTTLFKGFGIVDLSFEDYVSVDDGISTSSDGSRLKLKEENHWQGLVPFTGMGEEELVLRVREIDNSLKILRRFFVALGDDGEGAGLVSRLGQLTSEAIIKSVNDSQQD